MRWTLWIHLIAAAVWLGGMIVVAAVMPAIRKAGGTDEVVRATARAFGQVSWIAMGLAVISGLVLLWDMRIGFRSTSFVAGLAVKLLAVGLAIALALWHQFSARTASDAARRAIQVLILLATLGIYATAVAI